MTTYDPQSNQQLQNAISDALESERQRLAARLRDNIISQTNLIQAQLSVYQSTATAQSAQSFAILSTLVQQLSQQVYALERDLNPSTLQSLGLIAAIESIVRQQRQMTGANLSLSLGSTIERLPLYIELALFRWIQQSIQDAIHSRHSNQVMIHCEAQVDAFHLTISENGEQQTPPSSLALERLQSVGATVTYQASRYGGMETLVTLTLQAPVDLTEREQEVIRYLAKGLSNKEIALALHIKPRTIKFHLDNIYTKLNVSTRTEAAIYALQHGLTD